MRTAGAAISRPADYILGSLIQSGRVLDSGLASIEGDVARQKKRIEGPISSKKKKREKKKTRKRICIVVGWLRS